eukprot:UN04332
MFSFISICIMLRRLETRTDVASIYLFCLITIEANFYLQIRGLKLIDFGIAMAIEER